MRLHLTSAGAITLLDPSNFRALDVLLDEQPEAQAEALIARIGRREGEGHIRLSPAILRYLSPLAADSDWQVGFAAMVSYAASKGWLDEAGDIRAHITPNPVGQTVALEDFKAAMRMLAGGISVITTGTMEAPKGMVASSLVSISAEPPLVGFFVNETSSVLPALLQEGRFAANILGQSCQELIDCFVKRPQGLERFSTGQWQAGDLGLPVLKTALAHLECDIVATQTLGTHRQIVGLIRASAALPAAPLVSFNAGARLLAEVA